MNSISLGYSTCPNDTYIFHALAHECIDTEGVKFHIQMADVEELNRLAKHGDLDVSKLSIAAVGHLAGRYRLLDSGGAMGRGCGPLIVSRPGTDLTGQGRLKLAVPGLHTTAHLLLGLYLGGRPNAIPMRFDDIMPAINAGRCDAGVIIHEGRFTYSEYGLVSLLDLGEWWERTTGLPIPLGGIAVREDISTEMAEKVNRAIRESIRYARNHPGAAAEYIRTHAMEMDGAVIRQHIDLYVNDFSMDMGETGRTAIETLLGMGAEYGIVPGTSESLFALD